MQEQMAEGEASEKWNLMDLFIAFICLLVPALLLTPWNDLGAATDFPNYYAAAKMIASGHFDQVYDVAKIGLIENASAPELKGRVLPFFMFPLFSFCFAPLALLSYNVAFILWTVLLFAALLFSFFLLCNLFGLTRRARMWAAAVIGASGPCLEAIRVGQLSTVFLLALVLVASGLRRRNVWSTAVAQSLFWLKPHLLLPILCYELGASLVKPVLITCVAGLAGGVAAFMLGGAGMLESYQRLITSHEVQQLYMGLANGPTLRGQLIKLIPTVNSELASFAAYALVPVLAFALARSHWTRREPILWLLAVIVPLTLALSPHLHNYDLILLFPGLVGTFVASTEGGGRRTLKIVVGLMALLLCLPVYVLLHYFYVLRGGPVNPFFLGMVVSAIAVSLSLSRAKETV